MASQVSAPVTTTVIAFDIAGASAGAAGTPPSFDIIFAMARSLGYVANDPGRGLTLTLATDAEVAPAIKAIAESVLEFDQTAAPLRTRMMAHHGVTFRTELAGQVSFVGSATRSAQSALRRAPATGSLMATGDFATFAATLTNLPFRVEPMSGGLAAEGISQIVFASALEAARSGNAPLSVDDAAFIEFLKKRLAQDIGPFAAALTDRARRTTNAAQQLVDALCREIDKADTRQRFLDDAAKYIKTRTGA